MVEAAEKDRLLKREVVYDGEQYDRASLRDMVQSYNTKHEADLSNLASLRKAHDEIAKEMTKDLAETKSAWECLRGIVTEDFSNNFKGLLERIPVLNQFVADRPLADLLRDKIQLAENRTKEVGQFLATIERSVTELQDDIVRLNKQVVVAAHNEEKAARHVLALKDLEEALQKELGAITAQKSAKHREKQQEIDEVRQAIWAHGAKLRLFSSAEDRIAAIVAMNNNFLQILTSLHTNMQTLYEAGMEVLDELRGNLSGLATASEAGELTLDMQEAMQSLKKSINKVAVLASNTALYLTQNVERLTSEMKVYEEATEKLVENNLEAEKEIEEKRINDTIALAEKEYGLITEARGEVS